MFCFFYACDYDEKYYDWSRAPPPAFTSYPWYKVVYPLVLETEETTEESKMPERAAARVGVG